MSYEVVLFDFDHTLLDSDASLAGAFDLAMETVGITDRADLDRCHVDFDRINQALWQRVEAQEISPNEVRVRRFEQLIATLELDGDAEQMAEAFVAGLIACGELYDGAVELLDDLSTRCRLGMVTNGIGRVQRERLARLELASYFDAVVISGEVGASKPGSEIFRITFDAMSVSDRSTSLMVGDSLSSDIKGASNAGIDSVWFNPGGDSAGASEATHHVASLDEIARLI